MKYLVVHGPIVDVVKEVNSLLCDGWQCQGGYGVKFDSDKGQTTGYQAMIKLPIPIEFKG